jgi:lipopolysaccharide transport system ATP-binding protein
LKKHTEVIHIKNLSKRYRLGTISSGMLTKDIASYWARFRGKDDPNAKLISNNDLSITNNSDHVWAIKNINLVVKQGEILGIIGENGAGKSTLLKILSRITAPTEGDVKIKGRVGSLLEVGTGFHPELTGRENIYLNGAILGLRKYEINQRISQIIDFSGIQSYIDTPVKRYSSGMTIRLGFAVAAHLDPNILIVDEVLSVGDLAFKRKAIGMMKKSTVDINRTIIFVSHDLDSIARLCSRCIIVNKGEICFDGDTVEAIERYKKISSESDENIYKKTNLIEFNNKSKLDFRIVSIRIKGNLGKDENLFSIYEPIYIHLNYIVKINTPDLMVNITILNQDGVLIKTNVNDLQDINDEGIKKGKFKAIITIPSLTLKAGTYKVKCSMGVSNTSIGHVPKRGLMFDVHSNVNGLELTTFGPRAGKILFSTKWDVEYQRL